MQVSPCPSLQVLSGQGSKFGREKREGDDGSAPQEAPSSNPSSAPFYSSSSANPMPPPSDASFATGNQGLPSQSISPTGELVDESCIYR